MRRAFLALLFAGCGYGPLGPPPPDLEAGYRVQEGDSLRSVVFFEATAPDTLWWKLVWVNFNWPDSYLFGYGQAVHEVEVPVMHSKGLKFWMDFTVWNHTDTVIVTYMSLGG